MVGHVIPPERVHIVQYQKFIYYNIMGLDLTGNKLYSTSIGPKGEIVKQI